MPSSSQPALVVDLHTYSRPAIFPYGMDTRNLREITSIIDYYAVFVNIATGEIFDCNEYAKRVGF